MLAGAAATVAQQIVPFAAILAAPERRGAAIGSVTSGLLTGILLSRTFAGPVSDLAGWRIVFWIAAPIAVAATILMHFTLPAHRPNQSLRYGRLLASLKHLWTNEPVLRRSAFVQAFLFASFSAFWTVLALYLAQPPLGPGAAAHSHSIGHDSDGSSQPLRRITSAALNMVIISSGETLDAWLPSPL